jgi:hypothetical protein
MKSAAAFAVLLLAACIPSEGPMMAPHQDCLSSGCHRSGGEGNTWTAAGTWEKGSKVTVTDAAGKTVPMRGNEGGNFYTAEPLAQPLALTVTVDGKTMPDPVTKTGVAKVTYGGCNACHIGPGQTISFGPEMLPGRDCLECHAPGGMAAVSAGSTFYAAGTFPNYPPGTAVRVGGQGATTNAVGNFYITAPIGFPATQTASVGNNTMEGGTTYGGCNRCHVNGKAGD